MNNSHTPFELLTKKSLAFALTLYEPSFHSAFEYWVPPTTADNVEAVPGYLVILLYINSGSIFATVGVTFINVVLISFKRFASSNIYILSSFTLIFVIILLLMYSWFLYILLVLST